MKDRQKTSGDRLRAKAPTGYGLVTFERLFMSIRRTRNRLQKDLDGLAPSMQPFEKQPDERI